MFLAGGIMALWSETLPASIEAVRHNLYLIPLSLSYAGALFFGLLGIKYPDASIIACIENIDNAMAAILMFFFFVVTGNFRSIPTIGIMTIIATVIIVVGVTVSDAAEYSIPDNDFFIFECAAFVVVAICVWLYMLIVKNTHTIPLTKKN